MKKLTFGVIAAALCVASSAGWAADKPLLGIVSISANEANNARYIQGATKAADELGWQVNVVDAAGNADQANAGIQNFAQLRRTCDRRHGVPVVFDRRGPRCGEGGEHPGRHLGRRPWRQRCRDQWLGRPDGHPGR